jgi:hypothetical protein
MAEEQRKLYGAAAVAAGAGRRISISNEKVAHKWNYIVENGAGHVHDVLGKIRELIQESNMPGVTCEQVEVSSGMFGEKRQFLIVTHNSLRDYRMFINIRDFGAHLDASWYVTIEPRFLKRTVSKYTAGDPNALSQNIDVFSQQDLSAYVSITSHCVEQALDMLLEDLKQDPSRLHGTQSKGFLSVW